MTSTYILIGLLFVSVTMAILAWVMNNKDSNLEYPSEPVQVQQPKKKRRRKGRTRLSDKVWRQRLHDIISAEPSKKIRKSILNTKGGWTLKRQNEFLTKNSDLFSVRKEGNGTFIYLK